MPTPIFFNQLSMNLYQHAKNQAFSSFCSWDILILKPCNLIGWEHFGPNLRNQNFPKYGIQTRIQEILQTLIRDQMQEKLMTKFFNTFKKPHFSPFSPFFGQKYFFQKYLALSCTKHGLLKSCWVSEKTNKPILRKLPDRRMEWQKKNL